jgi:hypothetical protein
MKKLFYPLVVLVCLLASSARAQIQYNWWDIDAYTTLSYTLTDVNVPTGYWWGNYNYYYGPYLNPYLYPAYSGEYYSLTDPNVSPYVTRYGLGWGGLTLPATWWGGATPWYGFTDWYDYTYTSLTLRTVYTWSWYDIQVGRNPWVWDIYTGVNGSQAIPFDTVTQSSAFWSPHYWSYNGGLFYGQFTPMVDVIASQSAITAEVLALGGNSYDVQYLLNSQVILDAIANNVSGTDSIWIQVAEAPEPSTFALLGIGAIGLLAYVARRRTTKA